MDAIKQAIVDIDWGQPSIQLAILAAVLLVLFSSRKKRLSCMYIMSAALGAAGFLLSGWLGVATFTLALSYRIFQPLKAPWQAIITWGAGLSGFVALTLLIQKVDPHAADESTKGTFSGFFGFLTKSTDFIATNKVLLILCLVGGAAVGGYGFYLMRRRAKYPYLGLGNKVDRDMMYNGMSNPNLEIIPEHMRDPQRTFSKKMRDEKLDVQDGICAYQHQLAAHPKWEAYRSGIAWEGDHIVPWAAGGATSMENLAIICSFCNSAKSDKYGKAAEDAIEKMWEKRGNK